jgi:hypothetical protein
MTFETDDSRLGHRPGTGGQELPKLMKLPTTQTGDYFPEHQSVGLCRRENSVA